jgi:hypothetical protein
MPTIKPTVMTVEQFKSRTTPGGLLRLVKRGRNHIGLIDLALEDLHRLAAMSHLTAADACGKVLERCKEWLRDKGDKTSSTFAMRKVVILELANQVFERMQWELFELRKKDRTGMFGRRRRGPDVYVPKGLTGAYTHERSTYISSGKQHAISGSSVSFFSEFVNKGRFGDYAIKKNFSELTEGEYLQIMNDFHDLVPGVERHVRFMPKSERIRFMLVVDTLDGRIYEGFNKVFDSTKSRDGFPYVIDLYGSWYSADHAGERDRMDEDTRFNHSTFNAGKEVVSAGIVKATNGVLSYIDNNSGHYKPTRNNLHNAVTILSGFGIDFSAIQIGVKEIIGGNLRFSYYDNGNRFLQNKLAVADRVIDAH